MSEKYEEVRRRMVDRQRTLAMHEALEIHEALNFKTLCLAKSKLVQGLVFDQELKDLLQKDVQQSTQAIADLQAVYAKLFDGICQA